MSIDTKSNFVKVSLRCRDCDWRTFNMNYDSLAKEHVLETGHRVEGVEERAITYEKPGHPLEVKDDE